VSADLRHPHRLMQPDELTRRRDRGRKGGAAREYAALRDRVLRAGAGEGRVLEFLLGRAGGAAGHLTEPYGQPALRRFVPTFAFRPPDRLEIADAFDVAEEIPLWVLVHFTDEPARGPAAPPGRPLLLPPSAPILPL